MRGTLTFPLEQLQLRHRAQLSAPVPRSTRPGTDRAHTEQLSIDTCPRLTASRRSPAASRHQGGSIGSDGNEPDRTAIELPRTTGGREETDGRNPRARSAVFGDFTQAKPLAHRFGQFGGGSSDKRQGDETSQTRKASRKGAKRGQCPRRQPRPPPVDRLREVSHRRREPRSCTRNWHT